MIKKIISSGQTGVDRAALDIGLKFGIPIGGFCSKDRIAEDGFISMKYPLTELNPEEGFSSSKANVVDSDGTLILAADEILGTTAQTEEFSKQLHKPYLILDLNQYPSPSIIIEWVKDHKISKIHISGPRESERPGIYLLSYGFLIVPFQILSESKKNL